MEGSFWLGASPRFASWEEERDENPLVAACLLQGPDDGRLEIVQITVSAHSRAITEEMLKAIPLGDIETAANAEWQALNKRERRNDALGSFTVGRGGQYLPRRKTG